VLVGISFFIFRIISRRTNSTSHRPSRQPPMTTNANHSFTTDTDQRRKHANDRSADANQI
jgi:hypothetical protein